MERRRGIFGTWKMLKICFEDKFCQESNQKFCSDQFVAKANTAVSCLKHCFFHYMQTEQTQFLFNTIELDFLRFTDRETVRHESKLKKRAIFVAMMEKYSDLTAVAVKTKATVSYIVHIFLLKFSNWYCRISIDHGRTLIVLLPVSTSEVCREDRYTELEL